MGLTFQSTKKNAIEGADNMDFDKSKNIIALAGNPNVGKSTVFNALTGLKQHTGNWPGKTIANAVGRFTYNNEDFILVDLPGTYSLLSHSKEEEIARDFICSEKAKAIVVVADATCLERNLNLVLQILEITSNCILCINLMDQAKKKNIDIDIEKLKKTLNINVIGICASRRNGVIPVKEEISRLDFGENGTPYNVKYDTIIEDSIERICEKISLTPKKSNLPERFIALRLLCHDFKTLNFPIDNDIINSVDEELAKLSEYGITHENINDRIVCSIVSQAEKIADSCVTHKNTNYNKRDIKIDSVITSKIYGIPIMLCMLGLIFYLTIAGANYPSQLLLKLFDYSQTYIKNFLLFLNAPIWLERILIDGVYDTLASVVSVMLPPMAIFFPLFTILEDLGYLPRVAFNLDGIFKKCCSHGKQCLTMCMGLGCNAAGVTGARIIDSPRERLIAIITNNLVPCNGRFPTLITVSAIFANQIFDKGATYFIASLTVLTIVVLGVFSTFGVSYFLSKTILKGSPSQFTLELPPYRKPKFAEVIYRSVFDRTIFVLGRAIAVAAPAGAIIWLTSNIFINGKSLLSLGASFLQPLASLMGLDGYILISFLLGIPANEIVLPILLMGYTASGHMTDAVSITHTGNILLANGWNTLTAINFMLITLFHFPCATTLITIRKETKSLRWTLVSFALPTVIGVILCVITTQISRLFI